MDQKKRSKSILLLLSVLIMVSSAELLFFGISRFLPEGFSYVKPTRSEFRSYLENAVDTEHVSSGWLPDPKQTTPRGYRKAPLGKEFSNACISLYGDSFTWASDVDATNAWGNQLMVMARCRVDNYGVVGFGSDQAYLRFKDNLGDEAQIVILSHWAENIARNVNQDRAMIYDRGILLKPRFVVEENGSLRLIARPKLSSTDYDSFLSDPSRFLAHEAFIPGTSSLSKRTLRFPYTLSVPYYFSYKRLYLALTSLLLDTPSWYSDLYDPNHPSQALQTSLAVLINFDRDAKSRGKTPIVFVLPSIRDVNTFDAEGRWVYQPLVDGLKSRGVRVFDIGAELVQRMSGADYCDYLCSAKSHRTGHYTVKGNRLLATIARDILVDEGLLRWSQVR